MAFITYAESINEAIFESMRLDKNVICFGLGATDPKAIFGTTKNLLKEFGPERVFDMPTSENAMTGVAIGASMNGIKPIMTHQRLDFFLLAMDQLVNSAAKWHYMFGNKTPIPITIRLIIGRGWGQGPTHSQNLQSWFAHIPGLKVVMPSTPKDAKELLKEAIFDPNPVLFLEHRWLHNTVGDVQKDNKVIKIGKSKIIKKGDDLSIISMSYLTIEAIKASDYLDKRGISVEIVDLCSIKPLDFNLIFESVSKTGRILTCDTGFETCSVAGEIVAAVSINLFKKLKTHPSRLAMPNVPEPTSYGLTKNFYISAFDIASKCLEIMNKPQGDIKDFLSEPNPHDVPGDWFKGPF